MGTAFVDAMGEISYIDTQPRGGEWTRSDNRELMEFLGRLRTDEARLSWLTSIEAFQNVLPRVLKARVKQVKTRMDKTAYAVARLKVLCHCRKCVRVLAKGLPFYMVGSRGIGWECWLEMHAPKPPVERVEGNYANPTRIRIYRDGDLVERVIESEPDGDDGLDEELAKIRNDPKRVDGSGVQVAGSR